MQQPLLDADEETYDDWLERTCDEAEAEADEKGWLTTEQANTHFMRWREKHLKKLNRKMGHWNYRVIKSTNEHGEDLFQIHEAFYNDSGELSLITENPVSPTGETLDELRADLEHMLEDLRHPVLEAGKIQFAKLVVDNDRQSITLEELDKLIERNEFLDNAIMQGVESALNEPLVSHDQVRGNFENRRERFIKKRHESD